MLMAGDRVDAVVATTVPFIMRALGVAWPTSLAAEPPIALLTIGRIADMHFDLPPIDQQAERLIELGVHEMAGLSAGDVREAATGHGDVGLLTVHENWLRLQF